MVAGGLEPAPCNLADKAYHDGACASIASINVYMEIAWRDMACLRVCSCCSFASVHYLVSGGCSYSLCPTASRLPTAWCRGSGTGASTLPRTCESQGAVAQPPASPTYATGPGVFNLWLPGVWCRRPLHYPSTRGPECNTPGTGITNLCHKAGRVQLVFAGVWCRWPINSLLTTGARVAAARPPASPTYATGPGIFNLWLPGVGCRHPFNLP